MEDIVLYWSTCKIFIYLNHPLPWPPNLKEKKTFLSLYSVWGMTSEYISLTREDENLLLRNRVQAGRERCWRQTREKQSSHEGCKANARGSASWIFSSFDLCLWTRWLDVISVAVTLTRVHYDRATSPPTNGDQDVFAEEFGKRSEWVVEEGMEAVGTWTIISAEACTFRPASCKAGQQESLPGQPRERRTVVTGDCWLGHFCDTGNFLTFAAAWWIKEVRGTDDKEAMIWDELVIWGC